MEFIWGPFGIMRERARQEAKEVDMGQIITGPHKSHLGLEFHPQLSNGKSEKNCEWKSDMMVFLCQRDGEVD